MFRSMQKEKRRKRLTDFFKNMKMQYKFILVCTAMIVFLVAAILGGMYKILYDINLSRTKTIFHDENEIIRVRLESMRSNLQTCANMVTQDVNRVYTEVGNEDISGVSFIRIKNNLFTALDYDTRCFSDVDSILFIDMYGNICSSGNIEAAAERVDQELVPGIPLSGRTSCIQFPMEIREYFSDEPVLTVGKRIISMKNGQNIGFVFINVRESMISDIFPEMKEGEYQNEFMLVDEEKRIVGYEDADILLRPIEEREVVSFLNNSMETDILSVAGEDYLVVKTDIEKLGWTLLSGTSVSELTRGITNTAKLTIFIGLFAAVTATILIAVLSKKITRPIHALTVSANHIKRGDFSAVYDTDAQDEVGILAQAFKKMSERIQGLIKAVEEEQEQKRKYEFALIQTQIQPHFLYNTLDLIYIMCESDMAHEGSAVTKALADFYRISLSGGREIITIEEELRHIENYLYIQRARYADIMNFEIDCSPMVMDYKIVKLTLQPLIENAIYHGLKMKDGGGMIQVGGWAEGDDIILSISDNGVGMNPNRIQELLDEEEDENSGHFGLKSVRRRLQLYYGKAASIEIDSEEGTGTKITVKIPKV